MSQIIHFFEGSWKEMKYYLNKNIFNDLVEKFDMFIKQQFLSQFITNNGFMHYFQNKH